MSRKCWAEGQVVGTAVYRGPWESLCSYPVWQKCKVLTTSKQLLRIAIATGRMVSCFPLGLLTAYYKNDRFLKFSMPQLWWKPTEHKMVLFSTTLHVCWEQGKPIRVCMCSCFCCAMNNKLLCLCPWSLLSVVSIHKIVTDEPLLNLYVW